MATPHNKVVSTLVAQDPALAAELEKLEHRTRILADLISMRVASQMTQSDLAAATGMKQSAVARLESGINDPRLSTVAAATAALGGSLKVVPEGSLVVNLQQVNETVARLVQQHLSAALVSLSDAPTSDSEARARESATA